MVIFYDNYNTIIKFYSFFHYKSIFFKFLGSFNQFDRSDKGYITANDFRSVLNNQGSQGGRFSGISRKEAEDLVLRFDTNGDDRVSWREFVRFVEDRMRLHTDIKSTISRIQKKLKQETNNGYVYKKN